MRFSRIFRCLIFSTFTCCAQNNTHNMIIHHIDGSEVSYSTDNIDSITFSENPFENNTEGISVKRIYGDGSKYCAFTSLIKRDSTYYLAFREGDTHVADGDYGIIRILKSDDGESWELIQTLSSEGIDLRDPDLSIMPDGNLMLLCGARIKSFYNDPYDDYYTTTYYSKEVTIDHWGEVGPVMVPKDLEDRYCCWIWRLTWFGGVGYGVAYREDGVNARVNLLKTEDGINFEEITGLDITEVPNETRLRFLEDGTMFAMVRRSGNTGRGVKGYFGKSKQPYTEWIWKEIGVYLAGQDFIIDGNKIICATRISQNIGEFTGVFVGDIEGDFRWNYILPSSGTSSDTAYTGLLDNGDEYWVSYYSMHETAKPSIFIAKIPKNVLPR